MYAQPLEPCCFVDLHNLLQECKNDIGRGRLRPPARRSAAVGSCSVDEREKAAGEVMATTTSVRRGRAAAHDFAPPSPRGEGQSGSTHEEALGLELGHD